MDIVCPWFSGGRLDLVCLFVCVCLSVQHNTQHQVCVVNLFVFSLSFPQHSRTLDYPECLHSLAAWRSAEFAFMLREQEGERESGERRTKQRLWVCMCMRKSALYFCVMEKYNWGEEPKNLPDLLTKQHFLIQQTKKQPEKPAPPSIHWKPHYNNKSSWLKWLWKVKMNHWQRLINPLETRSQETFPTLFEIPTAGFKVSPKADLLCLCC